MHYVRSRTLGVDFNGVDFNGADFNGSGERPHDPFVWVEALEVVETVAVQIDHTVIPGA